MPRIMCPDTEAPSGVALVDLARKSIDERESLTVAVSPIFDQLQLRDVELAAEESLTAALAALQLGDRDRAVLHMVAALESTARADALEQKETI